MTHESTVVSHFVLPLSQGSYIKTYFQADPGFPLLPDWSVSNFPWSAIGPDAPRRSQSDNRQIYTVSPFQYCLHLCSYMYVSQDVF